MNFETLDRKKDEGNAKPDQMARQAPSSAVTFLQHGLMGEEVIATVESAFIQAPVNTYQTSRNNEIEVEVEDTVVFASLEKQEDEQTVRITPHTTDLSQGFLAHTAPLAQVFLGGVVGDEVVLRVPGQLPKNLVIKKIIRPDMSAI